MGPLDPDLPFFVTYLLAIAIQLPIWIVAGIFWGSFMMIAVEWHAVRAVVAGIAWGFAMWLFLGNILAIGMAWRPSAKFLISNHAALRAAVMQTCDKLKLEVSDESADRIVLRPKRALVRLRISEVRIAFCDSHAILTSQALAFWTVKRVLSKALIDNRANA
jgi:hypothetical protein